MNPPQQYNAPRMSAAYGSQNDELHMPPLGQHAPPQPREYSSTGSAAPPPSTGPPQYGQPQSSVPNVLQPGGMVARPPAITTNTAPNLSIHMTPPLGEYQTPTKPTGSGPAHAYSRSSPAGFDAQSGAYHAYNPSTPASAGPSSQYLPQPGPSSLQRVPNTPLGLADIRPRADSSMSDGGPGTLAYELANSHPGPSNYLAPWTAYAFDWCKCAVQGSSAGKLALGSYLEDGHNFINILDSHVVPTAPESQLPGASRYHLEFTKVAEATHSFPVTRLIWEPQSSQKQTTDLLATSGDHLRLWSLPSDSPAPQGNNITRRDQSSVMKLTPLALLSNSKTPDHTAPLTSLDWNTVAPNLIITSSIDTTCTIWDIPSLTAKTQLIAHDKEVYDVRFCANSVEVFVSCGQDGSVRMFDLRSLDHSTIIYEPTGKEERDANGARMSPTLAQQTLTHPPPLLRLATSPHDTHLLATFAQDSKVIRLLDVRQPGQALLELRGHGGPINCIEWSPLRRGTLASGGDDCQVLIWDLLSNSNSTMSSSVNGANQPESYRSPVASWQCDYEINNIGWVPRLSGNDAGEWLGVSAGRGVWGVRL